MNSTAEHLLSLSRKAGWHCCVIPHPALPFISHLQGCGAYLHMQPFFLSLSCHNGSGGHTKGAVCSLSWKVRAGVLLMHTPVQIRWWLRGLLIGRVEVHHSINKSIKLHSTVAHQFNQNQMWRCADFPSIHCLTPFVLYLDSVTHTSPSPSHSTWTRMFLDESTQKKKNKKHADMRGTLVWPELESYCHTLTQPHANNPTGVHTRQGNKDSLYT